MTTNNTRKIATLLAVLIVSAIMSGCVEDAPITTVEEIEVVTQAPVPTVTVTPIVEPIPIETPNIAGIEIPVEKPIMVSLIPDDYYNITVDQHFIDRQLYNYLRDYIWGRPISIGCWSFRELAELEHELTEKGCNVSIRWADCKTTIDHSDFKDRIKTDGYERWGGLPEMDQVACWLMIELNGEMVAYNPIGCYWIFEPDYGKNDYVKNGKWHDEWYYKEGTTSQWKGCTWTSYDFTDFDNIYELENYFISGEMQSRYDADEMKGIWWTYFSGGNYNPTDDFMISFGWWMSDEEYHERETRINEATNWFKLVNI